MKTITLELPDETAAILENSGEELRMVIKAHHFAYSP
jgi:hypothetical protein